MKWGDRKHLLQSHEYHGWNCLNIRKAHSFHQQLTKRIAVHQKFHSHHCKAELKRHQRHLDKDHCEHLWHHRKTHHVQLSCLASDSTLTTSWQWDQNHRSPSSIHNSRDTLACKIAAEKAPIWLDRMMGRSSKTLWLNLWKGRRAIKITSHNSGDTFRTRNHRLISTIVWTCLPKLTVSRSGWNIGCTMDPKNSWAICVAAAKPYEAHHWLRIRKTVVLQTQFHCMLRPQKTVGCRIISMQILCNTLAVIM